jgi:hypothetical protein
MKYPHTPYFDFSPAVSEKDKNRKDVYIDLQHLLNKPLVFTIKMDGSNLGMTREKIFARNGVDARHKSFDLAKVLHNKIKENIPQDEIWFGEWLYAKHSIHYTDLESYFQLFAIYFIKDDYWTSVSWMKTLADRVGIKIVPLLTRNFMNGPQYGDIKTLKQVIQQEGDKVIRKGHEGIVVRTKEGFYAKDLNKCIAKYVRANHVQTDEHWKTQKIVRNGLRSVN